MVDEIPRQRLFGIIASMHELIRGRAIAESAFSIRATNHLPEAPPRPLHFFEHDTETTISARQ